MLTNLTELDLRGNQISEIPTIIGNLINLTELDLSSNQISEIPEVIGQLTNLTKLDLSGNQISEIPTAVGHLTNLTRLNLSNNQISKIPEVIGQLSNLVGLNLWSNQISEIPAVMGQLANMTGLDLHSNQISKISEVIGNLTHLSGLSLFNNQISEIPAAIGNLINLTSLDLEKNHITWLPEEISQLPQLKKLNLQGNPINIPPDILAPKPGERWPNAQPILDYYFRAQDPNETTILYEAKILIVGEGGSGKTSLARKLLDPDYQLPPETEDNSTEGIDIFKWEFTGRNQKNYRINIWDFGGQEIYHQTHQFFLTERSLYLLVADSRKEDTDHYFWLQIIRLLSNDSPVLLIQNEKQNRTCNLNLRELRAEFENLRPALSTNLADNRGLEDLKTAIQHSLEDLLPNGIPFPNSWLNVRYSLENDNRNYIDCADYEATCRYHGITQRDEMFTLSRFLHSLGICLHFQEDPLLRRYLILKPNWGTAAVYTILDNPTVKQQLGEFSRTDLRQIWQGQYAEMRDELLQLMKAFKVCYEIPRRDGHYIAPHLLSPDAPAYDWDSSHNLILRYRYKGFMPKGILTRFIVELHKLIENVSDPDKALVWKTGVVLVSPNRARAEIIEDYRNRQIRIRLSGSHQRDFLAVLNHEFQTIHDSYERLEYDTLIPCNCAVCKASPQPFSFPFDRLQRCITQHRNTIECHESGEDVNVRRLLDDSIDPAFDRKRREMEEREFGFGAERAYRDMLEITKQAVSQPLIVKQEQNPVSTTIHQNHSGSGDNVAGDKTVNYNASTAELLQLVATLRQTAAQFPQDVQEEITIDLDDVEAEIQRPEAQRNPTRLKKRLLAAAVAATAIATPIAATTNFANTALDLGSKLGIELPLTPRP
ncbi:MAG: leucine-rich repeat domain-containing protein [Pegethrix bostrychoides GSE-TBD4-15B]|jgi:GTPase SAR1 family protein|uniref:non-specific serine/threonine protein kinase n=1 Tax=Pegethrix bostrychoides GSE-TBD4-15B TaxID=2839662 RepID=A0A951U342_9CYAN|nr:leucine-rich repeat domain-containing protein [Pegethrix bostrychoides GSE-TBD4-15B]